MMRPVAVVVLVLALLAAPSAAGRMTPGGPAKYGTTKLKAPKSGSEYTGSRGLILQISGKSISIVAFDFACGDATGRTSLNDIALRKTKRGYKFGIEANGNVTYSDDHPDENAEVDIGGRFSRGAKKVRGRFRVDSPRCPDTGKVDWAASR